MLLVNLLCRTSMFSSYFSVSTAISEALKFDFRVFFAGEGEAILMSMDDSVTSDFVTLLCVINYNHLT